jgi:hypothetical protein
MIQRRLRASASPSARRSRSAGCGDVAAAETAGDGLAMARWTTALTLSARQNAKRIAHPRGTPRLYFSPSNGGDYSPLRLPLG